jgi:hypothetical protein
MNDSPLFTRLHDFLLWLVPVTLKFPRAQRFVLAQQLQQQAFDLQSQLFNAARVRPPGMWLQRADASLAQLRATVRLAHELELMGTGTYEHASRLLTEMGRLLGAWMRSVVKA